MRKRPRGAPADPDPLRRQDIRWLAVSVVMVAVLAGAMISVDAVELVYDWSRQHEDWEVDEFLTLFVVGATVFSIAFGFRSRRDARRLRVEIEESRRLSQEIRARTADLEAATRAANEANAAKGDLLVTLSHELREPLKSVVAFARLLEEKFETPSNVDARDQDFVNRIRRSGEFALRLVSDLLDFSRLEVGRLRAEPALTDLSELIEDVRVSMEPGAAERSVSLVTEIHPSSAVVYTDPLRLRQILINLIGNAIKFSPDGSVTLRIVEREGEVSAIEVEDTGRGISESVLRMIREGKDVQGFGKGAAKEGVGIGLRISRALCDLLGFDLHIENAKGGGTVARVVLSTGRHPNHGSDG